MQNLKTEKFDLLGSELINGSKSKDFSAIGDELKREIGRLKLENTSLAERNLKFVCIISDLNNKIKDSENDKRSR